MIQKRPTLSFCAIVKNESKNLGRCLASVKPYVDELIVVDTGSTDDTVAIAQQYGAKISYFDWCNDFAAARNYVIALATGDWILTLDADEELIVHSKNDLFEALKNGIAYLLILKDRGKQDTEMQIMRLFKSHSGLAYQSPYHEHLVYEGSPLSTNHPLVKSLQGVEIIHYGYTNNVLVEKSLSRLSILEQLRETEGLSLMLLWTLSGMYTATQAPEQAQDCYLEAWSRLLPNLLTGEIPEDTRAVASWLYSLAVRSLQSEDIETSQLICEQGMQWFPDFPPLFYLNGLRLKLLGESEEAIPYFEHCIDVGKTGHYSKSEPFEQTLIKLYPAKDLGEIYFDLQQFDKAIAAFELAVFFDPNHTESKEKLALIRAMDL